MPGNTREISFIVVVSTAITLVFNFLAATGRLNGVTSGEVSGRYPTPVTPADYAFSIWSIIYLGLIAFSIYQLRSGNGAGLRQIRILYIVTCVLDCAWLIAWHTDMIAVSFVLIVMLALFLALINIRLRVTGSYTEFWLVKAPLGLYFGWVSVAALVNLSVLLVERGIDPGKAGWPMVAAALILFAAAFGVIARWRLSNSLVPLAVAWALTAIAVKQSGQTTIVVAAAVGVIASLIAALSFVVNLPTHSPDLT